MSLLPSGSNIVITGGSFVQNNDATKELMPLFNKVAPNAILNAGGRADPVRCHPGTRKEVMAKIEKWIAVTYAQGGGIFWLRGPAGAGKSAIVQTIAERCIERKAPMANFFFFRADNTRNHSAPIVATLLFQLFKHFPALKARVAAITKENPVIFRQSTREQFSTLIEVPLLALRPSLENRPLVILIDGLDECSSENKKDQAALLDILHDVSTRSISPLFIVLVASRTEAHLTMAFKRIGCHPDSIYLDESYRPSDDIRLFLTEELSNIKRTHSLSDTLPANWPPSTDLDAIVEKSSGQFVFAATVARFISDSAASPKRSLEIVLGLRPATRTSPFATLDSLYAYILSQADDWSSVHDILAVENLTTTNRWSSSQPVNFLSLVGSLGYTKEDILSSLSDLTSIIRFRSRDKELTIYHASLNDFLYDKHRAGNFYIDMNALACTLVPVYLKQITNFDALYCVFEILGRVTEPDAQLTESLKSSLLSPQLSEPGNWTSSNEYRAKEILTNLYKSRDPEVHKYVVNRWQKWFDIMKTQCTVSGTLNPPLQASPAQGHVSDQSSVRASTLRGPVQAPHTASGKRPLSPSNRESPAQRRRVPISERPSTSRRPAQAPRTASEHKSPRLSLRPSPVQASHTASSKSSQRPSTRP